MSTQLRLVDTTELTDRPAGAPSATAASGPRRAPAGSTGASQRTSQRTSKRAQKPAPIRARVNPRGGARGGSATRSARWAGDLRLDDRTRTVGRAGIAAAREALERVAAEQDRARSEREGRGQKAS